MTCSADCPREVYRGGLCRSHYERKRLGLGTGAEVRAYGLTPWQRVWEVFFDLHDLKPTDGRGWERARDRLRKALGAYADARDERRRKI